MLISIDAGNKFIKIANGEDVFKLPAEIGNVTDDLLQQKHGEHDYNCTWINKEGTEERFFAGTKVIESDFGGSIYGGAKTHTDAFCRVMVGVWNALEKKNVDVAKEITLCVQNPFKYQSKINKERIISALQGKHTVSINGKEKSFFIKKVFVFAEGITSFASQEMQENCRIFDQGSGTLNIITIRNNVPVSNMCKTFNIGTEKNEAGLKDFARGIIRCASNVSVENDEKIYIVGGNAKKLYEHLKDYYYNAEAAKPIVRTDEHVTIHDPIFSNAIGAYAILKEVVNGD